MIDDSLSNYLEEIEIEARKSMISKKGCSNNINDNYNNIDNTIEKYSKLPMYDRCNKREHKDFWYSEKADSDILKIEEFRPAIRELVKIDVLTEIYETRKIKICLHSGIIQFKVIVHGSKIVTIQYIGDKCYKGLNKIEIIIPFSSFVIIDDDVKDIHSKLIIEDVFYKTIDCRSIMLSTTIRTEVFNWEYKC